MLGAEGRSFDAPGVGPGGSLRFLPRFGPSAVNKEAEATPPVSAKGSGYGE